MQVIYPSCQDSLLSAICASLIRRSQDAELLGCELPFEASAFDVFAGYVMLDAWSR
jgi:hypothetical protein